MANVVDSKKTVSAAQRAVSEKQAGHKQARAQVTRQQLLRAARGVFAQDGFEHARIEDIAAKAGKTRGAFYANFKDKEDVFFAIFEEDLDASRESVLPLLRQFPDMEQRVQVFAEYLSDLGKDPQRTLLYQEFKVYAIRHPRRRKRLANLHATMLERVSFPEIHELLPGLMRPTARGEAANAFAIGAIMDGLSLNRIFDPGVLEDARVTQLLKLCLNEMLRLRETLENVGPAAELVGVSSAG